MVKNQFIPLDKLRQIKHNRVRWSNFLINAAIDCSALEKRALYLISAWVKENFVVKNLGVPDNWKKLYMQMTEEDLGYIGGKKNVPRTYEALKKLSKKIIHISYLNENNELVNGYIHWVDAFFYNTVTKRYDVRISPEILPYMINVKDHFTTLDIGEAMTFGSARSQKMYEFISMFSGDFRYSDKRSRELGFVYAKNVIPVSIDKLRSIFGLHEVKDPRTGKVENSRKYSNYNGIKTNILLQAQKELYRLYTMDHDCVWFDFQPLSKNKRGSKVKTVLIYIYTKDNPKKGLDRPWQVGDEELCPYDMGFEKHEKTKLTPEQKLHANPLYSLPPGEKQMQLADLLKRYLFPDDIAYYMRQALIEAKSRLYNQDDAFMNMIQVIQEKESQQSFLDGTDAYRRNCLVRFVFTKNLKKEFGWSIPPIDHPKHTKGRGRAANPSRDLDSIRNEILKR
jgi:hypothetical protein